MSSNETRLAAEGLLVAVALAPRLVKGVVRVCRSQVCSAAELVDVWRYELSKEVNLLMMLRMDTRFYSFRSVYAHQQTIRLGVAQIPIPYL